MAGFQYKQKIYLPHCIISLSLQMKKLLWLAVLLVSIAVVVAAFSGEGLSLKLKKNSEAFSPATAVELRAQCVEKLAECDKHCRNFLTPRYLEVESRQPDPSEIGWSGRYRDLEQWQRQHNTSLLVHLQLERDYQECRRHSNTCLKGHELCGKASRAEEHERLARYNQTQK